MQTFSRRFSVITGFVLLLIALIANALITRHELAVQVRNQDWVAHSRQVLFELAQTESLLKDAETGQRGFLYTDEPRYLAPYNLATSQIELHIASLAQLTADNPRQQARIAVLRKLADKKLSELAQTISLDQSGKAKEAKELILSDAGLFLMNDIRKLIDEMGQEESSLEAGRSAAYQESIRVTIACIYLANLIAALGLILLGYHVLREMQAGEKTTRQLQVGQEELRDREALLRTLAERANVGLTLVSSDRRYLYANPAYAQALSLSVTDVVGHRVSDVLSRVYDQIGPWLDRAFAGERVHYELTIPANPDAIDGGRDRFYAVTYEPLQRPGEGTCVIEVGVDITERKQTEESLRVNERRLSAAQSAAGMGTFDIELPSGKRSWSRELRELFGRAGDSNEPTDSELLDMCHPEDRALVGEQLKRVVAGKRIRVAYRIIRPNGEVRWIETAGTAVFNDAGSAIRHIGVGYDITERKLGEDQLRRSTDQLRALAARLESATEGERLRIARDLHDQLGQALTGIKMDLDWIVRKHGAGGDVWVPMVQDSMKMVDSTIALVRRLATELRPELLDALGLPAAIEWHTNQFQRRTGILCTVLVSDTPLGISGDNEIAVFRIFQEALTNIARHAQAKNVLVSLERERNDAIVTINDDGVGFVVDPEHSRSLGVLGMRERSLLLGAQFLLKSAPGHGTTITLRIPLEDAGTPERDAYEYIDR